jgi:hypothetical protein
MAGRAQDRLLGSFLTVAGQRSSKSSAAGVVSAAFGGDSTGAWAPASSVSPFRKRSGSSGLLRLLESGFGLGSLAARLLGLFDGGSDGSSEALTKYAMPSSLSFDMAETPGGLSAADYDQMGLARAYGAPAQEGAASSGAQQPQITVNIHAMDSRSFLDRSTEIAAAVRNAMLNSNSINDVVNEL